VAGALRCSPTFPWPVHELATAAGTIAYFDRGRGPAIVFVHGLGGDLTHFEHVAPALAKRWRVIGLDLPGCGGSYKRGPHSLASHAHAVLELMGGLGLGRAIVVGHSAGGQVAAEVALLEPERVERLVLINSAGLRGYAAPLRWAARVVMRPRVLEALMAPGALRLLARVFHQENEQTRKFRRGALGRPRQPLLGDLCRVIADLMPDLMRPTVAEGVFEMPALIVWGERDRLVPMRTVRAAAARFPRGRLEIVNGCGHMPIIEQPGRVIELLDAFLASSAAVA